MVVHVQNMFEIVHLIRSECVSDLGPPNVPHCVTFSGDYVLCSQGRHVKVVVTRTRFVRS